MRNFTGLVSKFQIGGTPPIISQEAITDAFTHNYHLIRLGADPCLLIGRQFVWDNELYCCY